MQIEMDEKFKKYIETRNKRVAKVDAIGNASRMTAMFAALLITKRIVVGGRSSCGGKVDPTWIEFTSWNEVVAKAKKFGYRIAVNSIKQNNGSPTMAGGWWYENEYVLEV